VESVGFVAKNPCSHRREQGISFAACSMVYVTGMLTALKIAAATKSVSA
jgi:hypothetical protein